MKMIICILQDIDKDNVTKALNKNGFQVTVMPSSGAYFRRGNATLLIGVEDQLVDQAILTVKENCTEPNEEGMKRATIFVLKVEEFQQL